MDKQSYLAPNHEGLPYLRLPWGVYPEENAGINLNLVKTPLYENVVVEP